MKEAATKCVEDMGLEARFKKYTPSLKLTASLHLKMDGWNTRYTSFLLGPGLFPGAFAVSFRECIYLHMNIQPQHLWPENKRLDEGSWSPSGSCAAWVIPGTAKRRRWDPSGLGLIHPQEVQADQTLPIGRIGNLLHGSS